METRERGLRKERDHKPIQNGYLQCPCDSRKAFDGFCEDKGGSAEGADHGCDGSGAQPDRRSSGYDWSGAGGGLRGNWGGVSGNQERGSGVTGLFMEAV